METDLSTILTDLWNIEGNWRLDNDQDALGPAEVVKSIDLITRSKVFPIINTSINLQDAEFLKQRGG